VAAGCDSGSGRAGQPNVIIAVFDACRPDKLGAYGFERRTTPALDELAEDPDSVVFERHYVQGDWTKPSTASLFTGLYVRQHRTALGHEPAATPEQMPWSQVLADDFVTLAEVFKDAGYTTFGVVRIPHLLDRYGFAQGFDEYQYVGEDRQVYESALSLAEAADGPFFAYLHFVACHHPFPPETRDEEYLSAYGFDYDEAARKAEGIDFTRATLYQDIGDGEEYLQLEPEDVRFLNLLYESQVRFVDRTIIRPFLDGLRERGLHDDTLIAITADHGEELYDHGGFAHAHALWEEVIRVPLIIKFAKGQRPEELGSRWSGLSRAIDLYPTLLGVVGMEAAENLPGRDLFAAPEIDTVLAERDENDWAVIRGWNKVWRQPDGTVLIFDLERDPGELNALAEGLADVAADAVRAVAAERQAHPPPPIGELAEKVPEPSEEELEALRALGYVN
jgi:arylsulfatase A-like enzyme